jgi:tRNA dimethylallyltransferase
LLLAGVPAAVKPFQSIGYKEALAVIEGRLGLDEALILMRRETRRYAKRQLTWFRREAGMHWLSGFGTDPEIQRYALTIAANHK